MHQCMLDVVFLCPLVEGLLKLKILHQVSVLYICYCPLSNCGIYPKVVLILLIVSSLNCEFDILARFILFVQLHSYQFLLVPVNLVIGKLRLVIVVANLRTRGRVVSTLGP